MSEVTRIHVNIQERTCWLVNSINKKEREFFVYTQFKELNSHQSIVNISPIKSFRINLPTMASSLFC